MGCGVFAAPMGPVQARRSARAIRLRIHIEFELDTRESSVSDPFRVTATYSKTIRLDRGRLVLRLYSRAPEPLICAASTISGAKLAASPSLSSYYRNYS